MQVVTDYRFSSHMRRLCIISLIIGPYISLVVVTRHDTSPGLFNTKFRLNFGQLENGADALQDMGFTNSLSIGRSSTCNMILDYRTVSTVHAKVCDNLDKG